jgi:Protein of unknown function (DUF4230)
MPAMNSETETSKPQSQPTRGRYGLPLTILAVAVSIVAIILTMVFAYHEFWAVPKNTAMDVAQTIVTGIRNAFNFTPKVSVDQTIFVQESVPIFELATVSRTCVINYSYTNEWAGSKKILILKGNFRVKGGFDLKQNSSVNIHSNPLRIDAHFPPPKLLSVELVNYEIEQTQNGYWNRIKPEDQQEAIRGMINTAKLELGKTVRDDAKKNLEDKLKEIARTRKADITFSYGSEKKD